MLHIASVTQQRDHQPGQEYPQVKFLEAGKTALAAGNSGPSSREAQLEAEVADLTHALGEAAVEIRVWK